MAASPVEKSNADSEERGLSGAEKAALFLLSINADDAKAILGQLEERDIQKITNYAGRLDGVSSDLVLKVKREFCEKLESNNPLDIGQSKDQIRALLQKVMPEDRVTEMMEFVDSSSETYEGLESLKWLDAATIAGFLRNEHPQTLALILAYLEAGQAAQILPLLPQRMQADVIQRLATLDSISPAILGELDQVIRAELVTSGATKSSYVGGLERTAEIINLLEKTTEASIFTRLDEVNPTLADGIRDLMFVFDNLATVEDRAIQQIMREVSNEQLTLALKTATEAMKEKIFKNISSRAVEMIKEELEVMGPVRLTDVEGAQQEILKIARRLEGEGKVTLGGGGGEAYV